MNKRHFIVTMVITGLMAVVLCGIKASDKPQVVNECFSGELDSAWVADPFDSIYAQAIVPQLLDRILTDGDWYPDTLCTVKGMPVMIAWDGADRSVIYSQGRVLADDPAMFYADIDLGPFTKIIQVGDKKLIVDFSDTASVNKLTQLSTTVLPGFKRCRLRRKKDITDKISVVFAGRNLVSGRYALLIGGALGLTLVSIFTAFNASKQLKEASDRGRKEKTESNGNEEDADGI